MNLNRMRHTWHQVRRRIVRIKTYLLYVLSEQEAVNLRPGMRAMWRKRYLRVIKVTSGDLYYIGKGFWVQQGFNFKFGERCSFGEFARILDHGPISVGDDFIAATGLQINSGTHNPVTMEPRLAPISIGNRVWCGANVTIVEGAQIGDDVVIGAGSLVRTSLPSKSIAAGVPARVINQLQRTNEDSLKWRLKACD